MWQRSINLSTCHSDLCLLHCSVVQESFAPNTSWKEAGRKPLYWCVIQMVFSTIHSNFQERSEQWCLYLKGNPLLTSLTQVSIIKTRWDIKTWFSLRSQDPRHKSIHSGNMEPWKLSPDVWLWKMCDVWCISDGRGGRSRKTSIQGCLVLNVFLTWGVIAGVWAVKGNVCVFGRCWFK